MRKLLSTWTHGRPRVEQGPATEVEDGFPTRPGTEGPSLPGHWAAPQPRLRPPPPPTSRRAAPEPGAHAPNVGAPPPSPSAPPQLSTFHFPPSPPRPQLRRHDWLPDPVVSANRRHAVAPVLLGRTKQKQTEREGPEALRGGCGGGWGAGSGGPETRANGGGGGAGATGGQYGGRGSHARAAGGVLFPLALGPRTRPRAARWEGEGAWRPRCGGRGRRAWVCSHLEALRPGRARPTPGARSPRLQRGARPFLGGPCLPRRLDGRAGARGREEPPSGARPAAVGHGGRDG